MDADQHPLHAVRYAGDLELFEELSREDLADRLTRAGFEKYRKTIRKQLLSSAVRVDPRLLPKLDASIRSIKERASYDEHFEAYVFEGAEINAFLSRGVKRVFLGLSSGTVNRLSEPELEFVIGHELGHALFQHVDVAFASRLQDDRLENRLQKRLLAWKRATEISADRCGLVCCGSLDVAASAMFRTLSGLADPGLRIRPEDFSEQWDHLLDEVMKGGEDDLWQATHPYPPMRMKAMSLFWASDCAALPAGRETRNIPLRAVDDEVRRILATIDPLARERDGSDPLLEDLLLWGGLVIAHADGQPQRAALDELGRVAPAVLTSAEAQTAEDRVERFSACLARRHKRLKPLEIHRVLTGLLRVAYATGEMSEAEMQAFCQLGGLLGVEAHACEVVRARYLDEQGKRTDG